MKTQPILFLALSFITGIIFQDYVHFKIPMVIVTVVILFLIGLISFRFAAKKIQNLFLLSIFIGLGILFHAFNSETAPPINIPSKTEMVFKVSKKLNSNEKSRRYEIVGSYQNQSFSAVLYVPKEQKELDFKHIYKAPLYVKRVLPPDYPFQFNYAKYLQRKDIFYSAFLSEVPQFAINKDISLSDYVRQRRLEVLQDINKSRLSKNTQEFLKGIILADRTEMSSDVVQDFNRSGLTHFLAISGTHVIVIFGVILFLFRKIFRTNSHQLPVVLALLFIWFFAFFIGWGSSVVRSCIMLSMYYISVLLERKPDLLHSLALSALVIVAIDTQQLFDVGFQLSFMAVLGIYWLNEPIKKLLPQSNNAIVNIFLKVISITLSAQIITLPIVLYYFHQFSFVSIFANLLIVPLSEVVIVFSFLMTILYAMQFPVHFLEFLYDFMVTFLLKIIHWFAGIESVFLKNVSINFLEILIVYLIIYLLRFILMRRSYKDFLKFTAFVLLFIVVRLGFNFKENFTSESLVISSRNNKVLLIREGRTAKFWMKTKDKKTEDFLISPYITTNRISKYSVDILPPNTKSVSYNGKVLSLE